MKFADLSKGSVVFLDGRRHSTAPDNLPGGHEVGDSLRLDGSVSRRSKGSQLLSENTHEIIRALRVFSYESHNELLRAQQPDIVSPASEFLMVRAVNFGSIPELISIAVAMTRFFVIK